jgi:magnesium-transporting ATPase (P-type)
LRAVAFIALTEQLRSDAPEAIAYFAAQDVAIKVISGDSPGAVAAGAALLPYPFLPRHLTIIDTLAIGVPSFFLALAANRPPLPARVRRPRAAVHHPGRLVIAAATFSAYALARARGLPLTEQRTAATLATTPR